MQSYKRNYYYCSGQHSLPLLRQKNVFYHKRLTGATILEHTLFCPPVSCVIEHFNYEHEGCINCVFVGWFTTNHYKMPRNKDGGSTLGECPEYIYQLTPSRSGKKGSLTYFSDSFYKIFPSIDKLSF